MNRESEAWRASCCTCRSKELAAKLEALNRPTSKGVHAEVSELEVNQAIIRTYLTTGDIVRLALQ
jgi:hypothetical protein